MPAASQTTPGQVLEPAGPQAAPQEPKRLGGRKWLIIIPVVGILGAAGYQLWLKPRQEAGAPPVAELRSATVVSGPLARTLRLTGQTSARIFASVTAPRLRGPEAGSAMILIRLVKSGSMVKKGELVAEIDSTNTRDHIDDVKETLGRAKKDIVNRKTEQTLDWESLQQTLRVAKAEMEKARLEAQASEVRTVLDQELIRLSVEEAETQYKQLQLDQGNAKIVYTAELKILDITRRRNEMHLGRHVQDLGRLTMHAPMDGLPVMLPIFRGGEFTQIAQGDQVGAGQPFMRIVNPTSMQLEVTANQAEATLLRLGQPAGISLDAFPGLTFRGKVYSIAALATGGWRANPFIRTIPIRVSIEGTDPRLFPDLSGAADVTLEHKENVPQIPLQAVFTDGGKSTVFVKRAGRFVRQEVQLGMQNNTHAEVLSGLRPGDEVALERPSAKIG